VSSRSKKQGTVAQSTMESENRVASDAGNKLIWPRKFIIELGVFTSMHDHVVLYYDHTEAIVNTNDPISHLMAKHIPQRYHVIKQYVHDNEVNVCIIHTDLNVAKTLMCVCYVNKTFSLVK
jgi:hypothetical protein